MSVAAPAPAGFGHLLRHWRSVRAKSQLDLACDAETTPRYVSFVETGRAQPSRQMVVRLARALDVPLRERNELLLAAGYAPLYSSAPLSSPLLKPVEQALTSMLDQHEPFPAVVLDRGWQVKRANNGAQRLFGRLFAPHPVPAPANVLRLVIEPGPMRDQLRNWAAVVPALLDRAHREAISGVLDRETAELVRNLRGRPDVARLLTEPDLAPSTAPIVDLHFDMAGTSLRFFSVVSTIGAPIDVTAQELRVEAFFPADDETRDRWTSFVDSERASSRLTTSNWSTSGGERVGQYQTPGDPGYHFHGTARTLAHHLKSPGSDSILVKFEEPQIQRGCTSGTSGSMMPCVRGDGTNCCFAGRVLESECMF